MTTWTLKDQVCVYIMHYDMFENPTKIEIIIYLIYDIGSIFSATYGEKKEKKIW